MTSEEIFLYLLRGGIWGTLPSSRPCITKPDWEGIFALARRQAVFGLVCNGASLLPESEMPPMEDRMKLMVEAGRIERLASKVRETAQDVVVRLTEAGFAPLVIKGPAVGKYYPKPELRMSGDVDIFIPDRIEAAASIFKEEGADVVRESDGAFRFVQDGITVELHPRYYDLHVPAERLPKVPSPCSELLMLSSHILKHAIGVGIGLKQFCDTAMAFSALHGKYDPAEYDSYVRKAGLGRWNNLLCSFLVEHLGVAPEILPSYSSVSTAPLLRIVMEGGNFGQHSEGFKASKSFTVRRFLKRLPFSLRISPAETLGILRDLTKGNLA